MYHSRNEYCTRLRKELAELFPYTLIERKAIGGWRFSDFGAERPPEKGWKEISVGYRWDETKFPVWFRTSIESEKPEDGERLYLKAVPGGESLVLIDGRSFGEINVYHQFLDLTEFADGKSHVIDIQTVPKGLFGTHLPDPVFEGAELLLQDRFVSSTYLDFTVAIEVLEATRDEFLSEKLLKIISDCLSEIELPRSTDQYFKTAPDNPTLFGHHTYGSVNEIWQSPRFEKSEGNRLTDNYRHTVMKAREKLASNIASLRDEHSAVGTVHVTGQSHIDYAWLWPIDETKRKIRRTFANAVRMMEKFPEFVYLQSSAQMYMDLKENDRDLFERVKEKISQGKWETIGGMWVESDCTISSAESLARQFLYGQMFFEKEFGMRSSVAWLPDVFGFSWILPQIMKEAGIEYFSTTKLKWNEKNRFPLDLFLWRGLDGSEIVCHFFDNPLGGYNGMLNPEAILGTWENFQDKRVYDKTITTFGYGDGGGGPTDDMVEYYERLKEYPGMPKLEMAPLTKYFKELPSTIELPVWDDELYFELHRGTYTSQARTKKLHKDAEDALYRLEVVGAIVCSREKYPLERARKLWATLLHNEFHDILPGSSINEAHIQAENELGQLIREANQITGTLLDSAGDGNPSFKTVINVGSYPQKAILIDDNEMNLYDGTGKLLASQRTYDGRFVYSYDHDVQPFSSEVFECIGGEVEEHAMESDPVLENSFLRVEVNSDGSVSVFDKQLQKEVTSGPGNCLYVYKDIPVAWDAWDIDHDYKISGKRLTALDVRTIESGPVRKVVQTRYEYEGSSIVQRYVLSASSRRLDIENDIDWHTRRTLLKAHFPVSILSREVRCDLSAGYSRRSTRVRNTFEDARFEFPAHRWVELEEPGLAVAILNDGKYGHSCNGSDISLTLLRSPIYPDFFADEGRHRFTYSLFSHDGEDAVRVVEEAEGLNKEMIKINGKIDLGTAVIQISARNLKVLALKHSEKSGYVLRLAEVEGRRGVAKISTALAFERCWISNVLEDKVCELPVIDGKVELPYRQFGLHTLRFE